MAENEVSDYELHQMLLYIDAILSFLMHIRTAFLGLEGADYCQRNGG